MKGGRWQKVLGKTERGKKVERKKEMGVYLVVRQGERESREEGKSGWRP